MNYESASFDTGTIIDVINANPEAKRLVFKGCTFQELDLSGRTLPPIKFVECRFAGPCNFDGAVFLQKPEGSSTNRMVEEPTFQEKWFDEDGKAVWQTTTNCWSLWIDSCAFSSDITFRDAKFEGVVWIANNDFRSVFGTKASFGETLRLMANKFSGPALFASENSGVDSSEIKRANFRSNVFADRFSIARRVFSGPTDFRNIHFGLAPEVDGVTLSNDTNWSKIKFEDVSAARAEHSYRNLMEILSGKVSRQTLGYIHLFQNRAKRKSGQISGFMGFLSLLYDIGSEFGHSVLRPILLLLTLHLICFALVMVVLQVDIRCLEDIIEIYTVIARKLFNPLFVLGVDSLPKNSLSPQISVYAKLLLVLINGLYTLLQLVLLGLLTQAIGRTFDLNG
ncbi:MAG: hypothetical protein AAGM21_05230 [Pseudomonadota bacterium]